MHVDRSGDLDDAASDLFRHFIGCVLVADCPDDLDVDGRGQAEVEHLRRDVRREEEEGLIGELLGERRPHLAHVLLGGEMVLLQSDEDLAVRRGDQRALAERQVEAAVGDADVV